MAPLELDSEHRKKNVPVEGLARLWQVQICDSETAGHFQMEHLVGFPCISVGCLFLWTGITYLFYISRTDGDGIFRAKRIIYSFLLRFIISNYNKEIQLYCMSHFIKKKGN